jgi:hypothetical protein
MNKWVRSNPILRLQVELIKGRVSNGPIQDALNDFASGLIIQCFKRKSLVGGSYKIIEYS